MIELPTDYDSLSWKERRDVRDRYVKKQNGLCCHCGGSLSEEPPMKIKQKPINRSLFPKSFFMHPVHLHHSHDTGLTIGAVHNKCNAVLWQYHGE